MAHLNSRRAVIPVVWSCLLLMAPGCDSSEPEVEEPAYQSILNLAHMDHLGEDVVRDGVTYRIVHIYADAPSYAWVADRDEGAACVDDAARAAVVYLRHFETTGNEASRQKAIALLRFVMYMQKDNGLFYNFVWDNTLKINTTHANSRADKFEWWAARGAWALATGARVLKTSDPAFAAACAARFRRIYPYLDQMTAKYGRTTSRNGRTIPLWLVGEYASDATSELLIGLAEMKEAHPSDTVTTYIDRFGEGIARMQYGSMTTFPYGAHASWIDSWHAWGNAQTQALSMIGRLESARREADLFYSRLLVDGWLSSMNLDQPSSTQTFSQIAYGIRCTSVGLVRLFEATGDERYAVMAGLAAGWLTGNNAAGRAMYDPAKGYGFDGMDSATSVNINSGAESTIEAVYTILEVERHPEARRWLKARGEPPVQIERNGAPIRYRVFSLPETEERVAVVRYLAEERMDVLVGDELNVLINP